MGNFQDAYECERLAVEQAQQDLILDELKLDDKAKQDMNSGTPRHLLQSLEHQPQLVTPASILPPDPLASTLPATTVPQ